MSAPEMVTITKAEHERLKDRAYQLEARCGHLMVDADRREERARKEAESCAEHGKEIQYLRHMASWSWSIANQEESARQAIVMALINVERGIGHHSEITTQELASMLAKCIKAQNKALKGPKSWPSLADCLRAGGCNHDGLSGALKAEIAGALGLTAPAVQGALFTEPAYPGGASEAEDYRDEKWRDAQS